MKIVVVSVDVMVANPVGDFAVRRERLRMKRSGAAALLWLIATRNPAGKPSAARVQGPIFAARHHYKWKPFGFEALASAARSSGQNFRAEVPIEDESVAGNFDSARTVFESDSHCCLQN